MSEIWVEVVVVFFIILIGGFFAAAEMSLVSLRSAQVERLTRTGGKRGALLGRLESNPNQFLAAVQLGVTLAAVISAAFGASTIAPKLAPHLSPPLSKAWADSIAFIGVTVITAFFSLVLGELVPKRLAMQRAERIAMVVVRPVDWLSRIMSPFIWLLSVSTNALVRLLGGDPSASKEDISSEELRGLVATHDDLTDEVRAVIDDVFDVGDRNLREVMIPRTEVEFLDSQMAVSSAARFAARMHHSRYPVFKSTADNVLGYVHVRDILAAQLVRPTARLGDIVRPMPTLPGSVIVLSALEQLRRDGAHIAVVADEYGGTAGIVTLEDLVEELVGGIADDPSPRATDTTSGPAGEFSVDGLLNLEDFEDDVGVELPDGPYDTVAGYIVSRLGRLPVIGDCVEVANLTLEVTELDGRRASRIRVSPTVAPDLVIEGASAPSADGAAAATASDAPKG
jgi:putative hemolysin